ncbi:VTT domain-containing protein [Nocardiopsis chromatogenes]|uniref:VTT domain-containing protein n=1 Tax=Nocardiopsis chromatogenes TaxID=280239 RepID=UPI0003464616|nr:VTT domain-containing protein [Nocardiopsis chromatogenes]
MEVLTALAAGVVAALLPVLNIEVYLVGAAVLVGDTGLVAMALAAAVGQTAGKLAHYGAARGALDIPWLKRRTERPKRAWAGRVEGWRRKAEERPWWAAGLLAASSLVSVPPLMVVCVFAGTVRMRVDVFCAVTASTRFVRFLVVVFAPGALTWVYGLWPG